ATMAHQSILSCKKCQKDYGQETGVVEPLTLWCGHTYCRECVTERFKQKNRTGTCPKLDCPGRMSSDPGWHPVTSSLVPPLQEKKLKCNNCDQRFTELTVEPITLDCGHSFCRTCIKANTKKGNVNCPQSQCKEIQFTVPDNINFDLLALSEKNPPGSFVDIEIRTKKGIGDGLRRSLGVLTFSSERKEKNVHPKLTRNRSEPIRRKPSKEERAGAQLNFDRHLSSPGDSLHSATEKTK
ncbi:unnamed protein product, partial [Meganyctiphanes norvegica]